MIEKQSSTLWQASVGNDAGLHTATPASTISNAPFASAEFMKKVVLLVDSNSRTRESRAKLFRTLGVTVHSAASAATARTRLASSKFDLILVDLGRDIDDAESLVAEIRQKNRKQRVAFLVGRPLYVASSLRRKEAVAVAPAALLPTKASLAEANASALSDFGKKVKEAERTGSY